VIQKKSSSIKEKNKSSSVCGKSSSSEGEKPKNISLDKNKILNNFGEMKNRIENVNDTI